MPSGEERARSGSCPSLGLCFALDQVAAGGTTSTESKKPVAIKSRTLKNIGNVGHHFCASCQPSATFPRYELDPPQKNKTLEEEMCDVIVQLGLPLARTRERMEQEKLTLSVCSA